MLNALRPISPKPVSRPRRMHRDYWTIEKAVRDAVGNLTPPRLGFLPLSSFNMIGVWTFAEGQFILRWEEWRIHEALFFGLYCSSVRRCSGTANKVASL
jgi:hypothetical protein